MRDKFEKREEKNNNTHIDWSAALWRQIMVNNAALMPELKLTEHAYFLADCRYSSASGYDISLARFPVGGQWPDAIYRLLVTFDTLKIKSDTDGRPVMWLKLSTERQSESLDERRHHVNGSSFFKADAARKLPVGNDVRCHGDIRRRGKKDAINNGEYVGI